jgi:hypothetical protein
MEKAARRRRVQIGPVCDWQTGEARAALGAARDYLADDDWKEHARRGWTLPGRSSSRRETEGLGWEAVNL